MSIVIPKRVGVKSNSQKKVDLRRIKDCTMQIPNGTGFNCTGEEKTISVSGLGADGNAPFATNLILIDLLEHLSQSKIQELADLGVQARFRAKTGSILYNQAQDNVTAQFAIIARYISSSDTIFLRVRDQFVIETTPVQTCLTFTIFDSNFIVPFRLGVTSNLISVFISMQFPPASTTCSQLPGQIIYSQDCEIMWIE